MAYDPYPQRKGTLTGARLDHMERGLERVSQSSGSDPVWDDIQDVPETFPPETHTHDVSQVEGLDEALNGKSDSGHGHSISQVDGLQGALDGKANAADIPTVPEPPSTAFGDLTGNVDGVEGATLQEILENLAARTAPEKQE